MDATDSPLQFPPRPPLENWRAVLDNQPKGCGLVVNIKSQGRWAVCLIDENLAGCLLRPGMLDYAGPAHRWVDALPLDDWEEERFKRKGVLLVGPLGPLLVPRPGGSGVLIVDYDARYAWALTGPTPAFRIDTGLNKCWHQQPARIRWLRDLMQAGRVDRITFEEEKGSLPIPPTVDKENPLISMMDYVKTVPPPGMGLEKSAGDPAQLQRIREAVEFRVATFSVPLRPKGWRLLGDSRDLLQDFDALARHLTCEERAAWEHWAHTSTREALAHHIRCRSLESTLSPESTAPSSRPRM